MIDPGDYDDEDDYYYDDEYYDDEDDYDPDYAADYYGEPIEEAYPNVVQLQVAEEKYVAYSAYDPAFEI